MVTKIQKWGNSQGFRIPKALLDEMHVGIGDEVEMVVDNGIIVIRPVSRIRNRFKIDDLISGAHEFDGEWDTGGKVGNEAW